MRGCVMHKGHNSRIFTFWVIPLLLKFLNEFVSGPYLLYYWSNWFETSHVDLSWWEGLSCTRVITLGFFSFLSYFPFIKISCWIRVRAVSPILLNDVFFCDIAQLYLQKNPRVDLCVKPISLSCFLSRPYLRYCKIYWLFLITKFWIECIVFSCNAELIQ